MRPQGHHLEVTLVTNMDPRRSLVAAIIWLVVALAASFAAAASLWAGGVAREIVVQQHIRRIALETDQLASDLSQAVAARTAAIHAAAAVSVRADLFARLNESYPGFGWIAQADAAGIVVAANGSLAPASDVSHEAWFSNGLRAAWIGVVPQSSGPLPPLLGDLALPVKDAAGRVVGVVAAHLTSRWAFRDVQLLILDAAGKVLVGPSDLRDRPWPGTPVPAAFPGPHMAGVGSPSFERLTNDELVLVTRVPALAEDRSLAGLSMQLVEPRAQVFQRANALAIRILWISICLGTATAVAGALGARRLTNRLKRLTQSAAAVGRNEIARIEVPSGRDEVALLGAAFAKVLGDLRQERSELLALSSELERRVVIRTREVERLAEESRYATIGRERLKIARDLHDTLAHSMMAMLSEVRLLRKLHAHDPASVAEELERAEEVAHQGLREARTAITQMRLNSVRDTGLGAALEKALERFKDRTGVAGEMTADVEAANFGDERAEVLFRIAEEALRNIERHASATRVNLSLVSHDDAYLTLRIVDDGIGFDPVLPRPGHYGLVGLREQAQLISAELSITSIHNEGTTVTLKLRMLPEPLDLLET